MKFRFALAACYLAAFALVGLGGLSLLPSASAQVFNQPKQSAPPPKQKVHRRPQPAKAPTAPVVKQAMPSTSTPRIATFRDPAAYCLVNLNIDEPGSTYIGQPVPGWVSSAWGGASTASANTLQSRAFNWRCMGGRVLVCSSAVGQSDCSKPVDERSPSPEILQFCSGKRKATVPPEMAGNAMPIWACKDSKPTITGYRAGLDERGYFFNFMARCDRLFTHQLGWCGAEEIPGYLVRPNEPQCLFIDRSSGEWPTGFRPVG